MPKTLASLSLAFSTALSASALFRFFRLQALVRSALYIRKNIDIFRHPELLFLHLYQSFLLICHQKVESGIGNHLVPIVLNMIGLGFVRAESIFHLIQVFRWRPAGATSPFFLTHFRPWDQVLKMVFYKITMVNRGGDSRTPGCTKSGHLPLLKEEKRAILCPFIYMHLRNFAAKMALAI